MYQLEKLTKEYPHRGKTVYALNEISLTIAPNSFVTIMGESGSGKSTLLLTLGGLIRPSRGSVWFRGKDLYANTSDALAAYRNKAVGFVLQSFNLVPYLTAVENVSVPMLVNGENPEDNYHKAAALLGKFGLADRSDFLPRELSTGQQQRVAIARALANDPEVILADEPTGNLDPHLAGETLEILHDLHNHEKRTIILVTHDPKNAKLGGVSLHLTAGKIVN